MRRLHRRSLAALALLLALAALAWLLRPQAVAVELATVGRGPLRVVLEEEGETRVEPRFLVAAPVAGRLLRPALREGDRVARGETVARLAPAPLDEPARERAEAALAAALAAQDEAQARVQEARAAARQATRSRERQEALGRAGQVAAEAVEQAVTAERVAAEALDAAGHRADAAACEVASARAALLPARGGEGREIALCAPADGAVLRLLERSERVVPAGTPLVELGDPARLEVVVEVLSTDAVGLAPGTPIEAELGGGRVLPARLARVEPAAFTKVSPLGVEEQRVRVVGELLAPAEGIGDRWRVLARIVVWEGRDVLQVATGAVFRGRDGWSVFAVEAGRARLRDVELGRRNADFAAVVAGLTAGDTVVLYPPDRLRDGDRVAGAAP